MTIAYVSDSIYPYHKGGKEKRLYELSTRLAGMGHEVHIYTMHWWGTPEKTRVEDGVYLHALCRRYDLYHGDRRSILQGLAFGLACLKLVTARADIIDVDHMPFFPVFSAWLVCRMRGKRLYGTWHEALSTKEWLAYMGKAGYIAAAIEALSIRLPHTITATSAHTKQLLATRHHRTKRVSVVTPGVDRQMISRIAPDKHACNVLYVGRLVKDKHIDVLVRAMQYVIQKRPDYTCTIIGQGIELPHLQHHIKQLGIEESVSIMPPLPTAADVYAHMKAADVFVLPSTREGFGMVVLEALSCGTPVITTNSPANASKDLVTDGTTGAIVALDAKLLGDAIVQWAGKNKAGYPVAQSVKDFDWQNVAQTQANVYAAKM